MKSFELEDELIIARMNCRIGMLASQRIESWLNFIPGLRKNCNWKGNFLTWDSRVVPVNRMMMHLVDFQ